MESIPCYLCHRPVEPSPEQMAQLASGEIVGVAHVGELVSASARVPAGVDETRLAFRSVRSDINGSAPGGRHYYGVDRARSARLVRIRREVADTLRALEQLEVGA